MSTPNDVATVEVNLTIPAHRINDLLSCAFSGGMSSQWIGGLKTVTHGKGAEYKSDEPMAGGTLKILDAEADEEKWYTLSRSECIKGLELFGKSKTYAHHFSDFIQENEDAVTGDVYLQFCLFGDVLYG